MAWYSVALCPVSLQAIRGARKRKDRATAELHEAIRVAAAAGLSSTQIAASAGVSARRVRQVVASDPRRFERNRPSETRSKPVLWSG